MKIWHFPGLFLLLLGYFFSNICIPSGYNKKDNKINPKKKIKWLTSDKLNCIHSGDFPMELKPLKTNFHFLKQPAIWDIPIKKVNFIFKKGFFIN